MNINDAIIGFYITFFLLGIIAVVLGITPYITRKTEAFGVSVPENMWSHPVLAGYKKMYTFGVLGFGALLMLILLLTKSMLEDYVVAPMLSYFVIIIFSFVFYYILHRKTLALKEQEGWKNQVSSMVYVSLSDKENLLPSAWWNIISFLITIFTIYITIIHYPSIPDKIPTNFGFDGNVNAYADKTIWSVMLLPFFQIFMSLIFLFTAYIIKRSRVTVNQEDQELSLRQSMIFRKSWIIYTMVGGIAMVLMFALLQFTIIGLIDQRLINYIVLPLPLIMVIGSIVLSVKLGQGGSRIGKAKPGNKIALRDDDKYWKMGVFYYNPEDPSLFVEKRFGVGWTSNFARPLTYVFLGALLLFIIISLVIPFTA